MIIDGNNIASKINEEVREKIIEKGDLTLAVILVGDDSASVRFVGVKRRIAESIGIKIKLIGMRGNSTQNEVEKIVAKLADDETVHGIIVQLPLPGHLNQEKIISLIPDKKDPDNLRDDPKMLSPVVLSIKKVLEENNVDLTNKKIVVLGKGKLVGIPTSRWLANKDMSYEVVDKKTSEEKRKESLASADVIISGVGSPDMIKSEDIKEGVVLIDAGTSEAGGRVAGDADPACSDKCSIFTPVPGGLGPITVSMLFYNLVNLQK